MGNILSGRQRTEIPTEVVELVAQLREQRVSWEKIAAQVGFTSDILRRNFGYEKPLRALRRAKGRSHDGVVFDYTKIDPRLLDAIPRDTRSLTGRLFGDPLPGRSALDRRRG